MAGIWCWLRAMNSPDPRPAAIAGLLLALAAGTRLSLGVWLPVAGLALVLRLSLIHLSEPTRPY